MGYIFLWCCAWKGSQSVTFFSLVTNVTQVTRDHFYSICTSINATQDQGIAYYTNTGKIYGNLLVCLLSYRVWTHEIPYTCHGIPPHLQNVTPNPCRPTIFHFCRCWNLVRVGEMVRVRPIMVRWQQVQISQLQQCSVGCCLRWWSNWDGSMLIRVHQSTSLPECHQSR